MCYFYLVSRKETLSRLPIQTLNVHMISQTLIFLLALYSCTASVSGSHSLDHHQTPPGAGLMSLSSSLFPFALAFSQINSFLFLYTHALFLTSFPLCPYLEVPQENLSSDILSSLSLPVFLLLMCVCVCVCTPVCMHAHTPPYIYILTDCWYIPVWSKKDGQRFYIKHNKDSGPSISRPLESAQKISFKILTGQE